MGDFNKAEKDCLKGQYNYNNMYNYYEIYSKLQQQQQYNQYPYLTPQYNCYYPHYSSTQLQELTQKPTLQNKYQNRFPDNKNEQSFPHTHSLSETQISNEPNSPGLKIGIETRQTAQEKKEMKIPTSQKGLNKGSSKTNANLDSSMNSASKSSASQELTMFMPKLNPNPFQANQSSDSHSHSLSNALIQNSSSSSSFTLNSASLQNSNTNPNPNPNPKPGPVLPPNAYAAKPFIQKKNNHLSPQKNLCNSNFQFLFQAIPSMQNVFEMQRRQQFDVPQYEQWQSILQSAKSTFAGLKYSPVNKKKKLFSNSNGSNSDCEKEASEVNESSIGQISTEQSPSHESPEPEFRFFPSTASSSQELFSPVSSKSFKMPSRMCDFLFIQNPYQLHQARTIFQEKKVTI